MGFGAEPCEWKKGKKGETWIKTTNKIAYRNHGIHPTLTYCTCRHGGFRMGNAVGVWVNAMEIGYDKGKNGETQINRT